MSNFTNKVRLLTVGKAGRDVERRCAQKAKVLGVELLSVPDLPDRDVKSAVKRESDYILERIGRTDRVILFDLSGRDIVESVSFGGAGTVFVVGGSNGVDDRVRARADYSISLSRLTFPHALFKLIALEVIESLIKSHKNGAK